MAGLVSTAKADVFGKHQPKIPYPPIAGLAGAVGPVLTLVHKELDGAALLAGKPFIRFGRYGDADAGPQDDFFRTMPRGVAPESLPERNDAADIAGIFCT